MLLKDAAVHHCDGNAGAIEWRRLRRQLGSAEVVSHVDNRADSAVCAACQ
jgi:hypothetical protein